MRHTCSKFLRAIVAVFSLVSLPSAFAIPTLTLNDGAGNTMTITDESFDDWTPGAPGWVIGGAGDYVGISFGVWDLIVAEGKSKPTLGAADSPFMSLNALSLVSHGEGTLSITFSDDSFAPFSGSAYAHIGGSTEGAGGTLAYNTYLNGDLMTGQSFSFGGGLTGFNDSTYLGGLVEPGSVIFAQEVIIHHDGAGATSFSSNLIAVPDGGSTVALLGLALAGLQGVRRKLRS